jgi:hypothetical protein
MILIPPNSQGKEFGNDETIVPGRNPYLDVRHSLGSSY